MFLTKGAVKNVATSVARTVQGVFGKVLPLLMILLLPILAIVMLFGAIGELFTWVKERPEVVRRSTLLRKLLEEGVVTAVNTWPYHPHGESASIIVTWEVEGRNNGERFVYSPETEDYQEVRIGQIPSDVFHALNPYYAIRIIEHTARSMARTSHATVRVTMPIMVLKKGAVCRMFMLMRTDLTTQKVA